MRGLESYQRGVMVGDGTMIVTSWTTVLDVDRVRVVTFDGRRLDAEVLGVDPECEIALLKVSNAGLPAFALDAARRVYPGERVFAITNLFGIAAGNESCSSQKGVVMAISQLRPSLAGKQTVYQGPIIVTVHQPADPRFDFPRYVEALKARGVLISNFWNTAEPTMRIGAIGALTPEDMQRAIAIFREALAEALPAAA
jgi:hypothetical protein